MKRFLLSKAFILFSLTILAVSAVVKAQPESQKSSPRLVIGITVDGFPSEWINRHWNLMSEGGLKKLLQEGIYYPRVDLPFIYAAAASSMATLSTGTIPAVHGIVSESWYNRLRREEVNPTENYLLQSVGTNSHYGKHGPGKLAATTVGDMLTLMSNSQSKVVSISLDATSSILAGGHRINASYWFDNNSGNWITSTAFKRELPEWLNLFNSRKTGDLYLTQDWNLLLSEDHYLSCLPDENSYESGFNGKYSTFPYKLSRLKRASMTRDYSIIAQTPFGSKFTFDLGLAAIAGDSLGADADPDLLMMNFPSIYYISQRFGSDSREVLDAFLRFDMDLQHFLVSLEDNIGRDEILVFIVSSHGLCRDPDYAKALNFPSGYFRNRNAMALLNSYLSNLFGDGVWVENYINQQVYLNENQVDNSGLPYHQILESASRFLTRFEGVSQAIPATQLINGSIPDPWDKAAQSTYHPDRSGDIFIILQPGWIEESGLDTDSKSPYAYDRHIPLVFYGWNLQAEVVNRPASLLDIAPTLSYLLKIPRPDAALGRILEEFIE